jgi:hypothetical protein
MSDSAGRPLSCTAHWYDEDSGTLYPCQREAHEDATHHYLIEWTDKDEGAKPSAPARTPS